MKNIKETDKFLPVNLRMEVSMVQKLRALAKANERSLAAQIRHIIAKVLK